MSSNGLSGKVRVENFPSRVEFFMLLDQYIEDNGLIKDYKSDNKDKLIILYFKNVVLMISNLQDVAFDFAKYLNLLKSHNRLYSNIKFNILVDSEQTIPRYLIENTQKLKKKKRKLDKSINSSKSIEVGNSVLIKKPVRKLK